MMSVKFYNDRLGLPMGWSNGHVDDDVMTSKYLRLDISETVQDTGLVSIGHR